MNASQLPLASRHALVTGASRGIGAAIARSLANAGANLTLVGRDRNALQTVAASLHGVQASCQVADVGDAVAVRGAVTAARAALGPISVLINNAGQAGSAPLPRITDDLWAQMLATNLTGSFLFMRECIADMVAAKYGRIVNVVSTAGLTGYSYVAAYCAAKHAVIGLTRAAALEYAQRGVTINAVCPGYTDTDLVRSAVANIREKTGRSTDEALAELVKTNPQGRLVRPEEVANATLWLCSPGSESVTGQSIVVAGGEVM